MLMAAAKRLMSRSRRDWRSLVGLRWANASWSQEGEDILLYRMIGPVASGFYVDVGAHDPFRFSNSAFFYRMGWRGICVEPDPDGYERIRKMRPRDIVLNAGVSSSPSAMTLMRFDEPALNTFDQSLAQEREKTTAYRIRDAITVDVVRLDDILEQHVPMGQSIDFLSVDAEGFDLDILQSNNWSRFRPCIVVAEGLDTDLGCLRDDKMVRFMHHEGYKPVAKTLNSVFFKEVAKG